MMYWTDMEKSAAAVVADLAISWGTTTQDTTYHFPEIINLQTTACIADWVDLDKIFSCEYNYVESSSTQPVENFELYSCVRFQVKVNAICWKNQWALH